MDLHTWLLKKGMSTGELASILGVTYQAAWAWRKHRKYPSGRRLAEIERLTSGEVSAKSWGDSHA
tara:strand:- start:1446 stop:1640 length:195 start_codon:yes stop_codon:yes gene_type:complete